jgi:hypothetical protein
MQLTHYNYGYRMDDDDEPKELPENPMEKMLSSWQFDKIHQLKKSIFFGVHVDDKSAKTYHLRLLYLDALDSTKEISFLYQ